MTSYIKETSMLVKNLPHSTGPAPVARQVRICRTTFQAKLLYIKILYSLRCLGIVRSVCSMLESVSRSVSASRMSLPPSPHQPKQFVFPKRSLGEKSIEERACRAAWFDKWSWLHYNETEDYVLCHICATAFQKEKLKESAADAFVSKGFTKWKDATVAFQSHQQTKCHKDAVDVVITIPSTTKDVGELLSKKHTKEKEINRMFMKIVTSILGEAGD